MKRLLSLSKTLLATAALTFVVSSAAHAQGGLNLSWTDCGAAGSHTRTSTCLSNTGGNLMVGSAISPHPIDLMVAMAAVLDLQTNQAALTPWWNFDSPGCRSTPSPALTASYDFTTGPFTCLDIWAGAASGGVNYTSNFNNVPNRGRIRLVCAVAAPLAVDNITETYYFKVNISNAKTVGTGNCAGCTDGACIVFNSLELDQNPGVAGGNTSISNPLLNNFVVWQSGGANITGGCPAAVPTINSTWGSVKSLYR